MSTPEQVLEVIEDFLASLDILGQPEIRTSIATELGRAVTLLENVAMELEVDLWEDEDV